MILRNSIITSLIIVSGFYYMEARDVHFNREDVKCGTFLSSQEQIKFLKNIQVNFDTIQGRPILQKSTPSDGGHFLIHYNISGFHSVNLTDNNHNGIPDYIDSTAYFCELAYKVYTDTMGYNAPFVDDNLGGSNAYDVYLMNIGNDSATPFYGLTRKDKEKLPRYHFPRYISHLFLDNDYSPADSSGDSNNRWQTYSTFGINALKITIVHEFHHALQFTYGEQIFPSFITLNEMTSTWMEYRIYPEVKDYYQYVQGLFMSPNSSPFGVNGPYTGYRWSIFGHYIYRHYGDSLLLRLWEKVGEGINGYQALSDAFKENGSSLANEWCNFMPWLYYTGYRAKEGEYFDDAKEFPLISFYRTEVFKSSSFVSDVVTQSFEVCGFRVILSSQVPTSLDTLDVIISNTDLNAAAGQINSDIPFTIICTTTKKPDYRQIDGTQIYYNIQASRGNICDRPFFRLSNPVDIIYPNPFYPERDKILNIPAPSKALLNQELELVISTVDMLAEKKLRKKIVVSSVFRDGIQNDRVFQIDATDVEGLTSGVYIYSYSFEDEVYIGKFMLKR